MGIFLTRPLDSDQDKSPIVVIGTGSYGLELVKRLTLNGYRVFVGSRTPENILIKARVERANGEIMHINDAITVDPINIVIIAIPSNCYISLPAQLLENKIVIDVSNRPLDYKIDSDPPSLAERLQVILPNSKVVKAFNTLSAYELQNNCFRCNREVPVCSDDYEASREVMALVQSLGFIPVNYGTLANATDVENVPLKLFPRWKLTGLIALGIFVFAFLIMLFRIQICPNITRMNNKEPWDWQLFSNLLLDDTKTAFALSSLTMLSICYFPGIIAGWIQLYRGTRYEQFPMWLDRWLRSRKEIGISALLFTYMHILMVIFTTIEHGLPKNWSYFTQLGFGSFAVLLMSILGITSFPTVSQSLTWRETDFVLTTLGWMSLVFSLLHMGFARWHSIISNRQTCIVIPGEDQIFIVLPLLTVFLKIFSMLPCISRPIKRIRSGYERIR